MVLSFSRPQATVQATMTWTGSVVLGKLLGNPGPATVATSNEKDTTPVSLNVLLSYPTPKPPSTGHPEACWDTMPLLAQAPTNGPNAEVTSSGKNGIVCMENAQHSRSNSSAAKTCPTFGDWRPLWVPQNLIPRRGRVVNGFIPRIMGEILPFILCWVKITLL